jgi:hypothetical protein
VVVPLAGVQWVSEKYFPEGSDLWDVFFPSECVISCLASPPILLLPTDFFLHSCHRHSMPAAPRAHAFLTLLHHLLESPTSLSDFTHSNPVVLTPPIALTPGPPTMPENVDTPEELLFAKEMQLMRAGVVSTVPAIQKKEEEEREKLRKQKEKEEVLVGATAGAGASVFSFPCSSPPH